MAASGVPVQNGVDIILKSRETQHISGTCLYLSPDPYAIRLVGASEENAGQSGIGTFVYLNTDQKTMGTISPSHLHSTERTAARHEQGKERVGPFAGVRDTEHIAGSEIERSSHLTTTHALVTFDLDTRNECVGRSLGAGRLRSRSHVRPQSEEHAEKRRSNHARAPPTASLDHQAPASSCARRMH